jgi:ubiquitin-activating enzyme E1
VAAETAKNLALQGVGALTLIDNNLIETKDIGVNFFYRREDVGQSRASVMLPRLQELNPLCRLNIAESLNEDILTGVSALVITQPLPLPRLIELNEFCRSKEISFFFAHTSGVSADLFVDHGDKHVVFDFNGEKPLQKLITDVTRLSETEALVRYETPEGQQPVAVTNGAFEVSEVEGEGGIEAINGRVFSTSRLDKDPVKTVRIPYAMEEGQKYLSGGLLTEKKLPTSYPMKSLAAKLRDPGTCFADPPSLVQTDLINFGAEHQQHVAFYAAMEFFTSKGHFPRPYDTADLQAVMEIAKALVHEKKVEIDYFELNEALCKKYLAFLAVELQPMSAFLGGVLAQEVVKCTGKFTPIPGFLHFSAFETLPGDEQTLYSAEDKAPRNHANDELATVFGWSMLEKVSNLRYFMVGCGALGCEFMKNFALNGIFCGPQGHLTVTDADRIELSNLTRQFLFREHNVGQPKSRAAAAMAQIMNPDLKVHAMELFVGPKTEDSFNDQFWLNLDGVCNALDNIEARLYVDKHCVKYEKSLLESGTMGTNGNVGKSILSAAIECVTLTFIPSLSLSSQTPSVPSRRVPMPKEAMQRKEEECPCAHCVTSRTSPTTASSGRGTSSNSSSPNSPNPYWPISPIGPPSSRMYKVSPCRRRISMCDRCCPLPS